MIFKQFFDNISFTYTYLIANKKGAEACIIDPVKLVSPKLYYTRVKQWSVKVVANNFHSALWYYIISTVFLWINYYYNFF